MNATSFRPWDLHVRIVDFQGEITRTERQVLLVLARWANKQGEFFPSVGTIAKAAGLKPRSVQLALKRLTGRGILTTLKYADGGRGRTTVRRINAHALVNTTANKSHVDGADRLIDDDPDLGKGRSGEYERAHDTAGRGAQGAHEPEDRTENTNHQGPSARSDAVAEQGGGGGESIELMKQFGVREREAIRLALQHPAELIMAACEGAEKGNNPAALIVARLRDPDLRGPLQMRADAIRLGRREQSVVAKVIELMGNLSDGVFRQAHSESRPDPEPPCADVLRKRYKRVENLRFALGILEHVAENGEAARTGVRSVDPDQVRGLREEYQLICEARKHVGH